MNSGAHVTGYNEPRDFNLSVLKMFKKDVIKVNFTDVSE
jgi:hypothetical protein